MKKWADFLGVIFILAFLIQFTHQWFECLIVYGKLRIHFTVYEYDPIMVAVETVILAYTCVWGLWRLGPTVMGRPLGDAASRQPPLGDILL